MQILPVANYLAKPKKLNPLGLTLIKHVEARKKVSDKLNIKNFHQMDINRSTLNSDQTLNSKTQN